MSDLILSASGVRKRFDGRDILKGVSLSLQKGDVVAIIGRSGSGKSTFLRCLAELERIDAGRIEIGGEAMVDTEKKGYEPESRLRVIRRRMGYVFQDFNLFPHFTVLRNITEAQRCVLGRSRKEAEQRARTLLARMGLSDKADTYPCFLSGGQQQRVALARALAVKPDVLLMDEPLSNLDAKLRLEMRQAIRNIQRELGITTVYVTHDQEEAMSISDTIAVMDHGVIQHLGAPKEIYQRPANLFVSTFIGRSNILDGKISGGTLLLEGVRLNCDEWQKIPSGDVKVSVRPEEFLIRTENDGSCIPGQVTDSIYLGMDTHYMVKLADGSEVLVIQESTLRDNYRVGEQVWLAVNRSKINIFSVDGQRNYLRD